MSRPPGRPSLSAEVVQGINYAHSAGFSNREIADLFGVSVGSVQKYVRKPRKPGRPGYGPVIRSLIVAMYESGVSSRQVAKHFRCSQRTVLLYASEAQKQREQGD